MSHKKKAAQTPPSTFLTSLLSSSMSVSDFDLNHVQARQSLQISSSVSVLALSLPSLPLSLSSFRSSCVSHPSHIHIGSDPFMIHLAESNSPHLINDQTSKDELQSILFGELLHRGAGSTISLKGFECWDQTLSKIAATFDRSWKGEGGVSFEVIAHPMGQTTYILTPPERDAMLLVIQMENTIKIGFEDEDGSEVESMQLGMGDIVFVPPGSYAVASNPGDKKAKSASLYGIIRLPIRPIWDDFLADLIDSLPSSSMSDASELGFGDDVLPQFPLDPKVASQLNQSLARNLNKAVTKMWTQCRNRTRLSRADLYMASIPKSVHLGMESMLDSAGGILRIPDFLPRDIAEKLATVVESIGDQEWILTEAIRDATQNNVDHRFFSSKTFPNS
eukprot:TRINITY_DN11046_c0_g1_i1.p1 TRINITY_DN11046_c0_g1~~TRINITY_DN11046_c0_g1_i1.p1  ORF type:complete len:391 (+),score=101.59 TRINITY_DN11046_c0_g1_i1:43-1215(+)